MTSLLVEIKSYMGDKPFDLSILRVQLMSLGFVLVNMV